MNKVNEFLGLEEAPTITKVAYYGYYVIMGTVAALLIAVAI